jgi:hypothetical protein
MPYQPKEPGPGPGRAHGGLRGWNQDGGSSEGCGFLRFRFLFCLFLWDWDNLKPTNIVWGILFFCMVQVLQAAEYCRGLILHQYRVTLTWPGLVFYLPHGLRWPPLVYWCLTACHSGSLPVMPPPQPGLPGGGWRVE